MKGYQRKTHAEPMNLNTSNYSTPQHCI